MDLWDIPAAFLGGMLTGTGIGGGGLFVIYLTFFRAADHLRAQWLNLILFISASLFSVPYHLSQRKVDPALVVLFAAAAIPGTLAGYALRGALPVFVIRKFFGGLMALTGAAVLLKKGEKNGSSDVNTLR